MNERGLPTRFHIGTQKAGSTFFYNLLKSHPEVSLSSQTEVHYYSKYFDRGDDWYRSLYTKPGVRIDTSPKYFMNGDIAAPRIKEVCGDEAMFVLILRNPIDLINSHYQMNAIRGHFTKHPEMYPTVPKNVVECVTLYPDYLKQAQYFTQLKQVWLSQFNETQFKVVIFENFVKNVDVVMADILDFWKLPPAKLTAQQASKNKMLRSRWLFELRSRVVRWPWLKEVLKNNAWFSHLYEHWLTESSSKKITPAERAALAELLQAEVEQLEALVGFQINEWRDFHTL